MTLGNHIKEIRNQLKSKNKDTIVQSCLQVIVEKFFQDGVVSKSIELDVYWNDNIIEKDNIWDDPSNYTLQQRLFAHKQAKKELEELCKKLNTYGFKCKAIARLSKNGKETIFHTPWIKVKL